MLEINKNVIVTHTPQKMFELVNDIENYPRYLPWCAKSEVKHRDANQVIGTIYIEYLKIKTSFTTKNINTPNSAIDIELIDGPFKHLTGQWLFMPLGKNGCKINFILKYQFSNIFIEKLIQPAFSYISKNIINDFIKEANKQSATK